jgi:hypothetical protein
VRDYLQPEVEGWIVRVWIPTSKLDHPRSQVDLPTGPLGSYCGQKIGLEFLRSSLAVQQAGGPVGHRDRLRGRPGRRLRLPTGEKRRFLEEGDEIVLCGWAERPGAVRIGLGECRGRVV